MKPKSFPFLASKTSSPQVHVPLVAACFLTFVSAASAAPFTAGNLAVYRVGSGTGSLVNTGNEVFIDEYTPAGSFVQSIPMPTTVVGANKRLVASGTATTEGMLTRSADGQFLIATGYDATPPVAAITSSASATVNRVIGRLNAAGAVDTTTALTDAATGSNPRGAASSNGTDLWIAGGAGGIRYAAFGGITSTQLSTTVTNLRQPAIFNGQLLVSTGSGTAVRIGTVGGGLPTTSGQTISNLPGFPTAGSPYAFFLADLDVVAPGLDTLYVADDGVGALTKFSLVGGNWTSNGIVGTDADDYRGLTATVSGSNVTLFATRKGGSGATGGGEIVSLVDSSGYNAAFTGTPTLLASAATNTAFRGIALAPVSAPPPVGTVSISAASISEGNGGTSILSLNVTRSNTATAFTVSYAVTGGTATSGSDYATVTPGSLNFTAGGAASQTIDITVNGDTTIEVNETVALTLSGIVDAVGVTTLDTATASGTITNDDSVASSFPASGALTSSLKGNITLAGAEIPAFDPISKRGFTSSNVGIQVVDLTDPAAPVFLNNIAPSTLGVVGLTSDDVSSIAVRKGAGANPSILAAAIIANPKTSPGTVLFLNAATGALIGSTTVGVVPDHIAFTPDGTKLLVCNEGELSTPETTIALAVPDAAQGTVSIIPVNAAGLPAAVQTADFTAFDAQTAALKTAGVRIFDDGVPSTDFEPEFLAISADGTKAMVTLQEANAVAVLDIATATFTSVVPLGKKNFSAGRHDFSDRDGAGATNLVNPTTGSPVFGLYMPDAVASYSAGGQTYYVTANEGDDRNDFINPDETTTVGSGSYDVDDTVFPNELALKNQASLGRLTVSNAPGLRGDTDNDGDIDEILSYGGRSFSILDSTGAIVFDSGDMIENIVASQFLTNFDDGRSDNKGPEPEGVTIAIIGGRTYAFVGLERSHMVLTFDVTNPLAVTFTGGLKRTGDLNPEGLVVVSAADSPTGKPLLLVANEVSNTLTVHEITNDPFATWLTYNGYTSGGIDTDSDNDGLTDRVEFFFNQNPNNGADFGNLPLLVPNGGAFELDFTRLNEIGATTGTLKVSTDLTSWTNALLGTDYTVASAVVNGDETAFTYALPGTGPSAPGTSPTYLTPNTSHPVGASLGGVRVVNEGLVGVGRISGESLDAYGETMGAASGLFISGWQFSAGQFSGKFNILPDRGYNTTTPTVIFSNYAARLHEVDFTFVPYYGTTAAGQGQIAITDAIPNDVVTTRFTYLDENITKFTTGLNPTSIAHPILGQTVGTVTAANGPGGAATSLLSFDAEAVHLFDEGSGFVSDEYGTYIARFNAAKQITGITQLPESARPHSALNTLNFTSTTPAPISGRRVNQGLEGMSVTPDGTLLFALMQSALVHDTGTGAQGRNHTRLFVYNVAGTNRETPVLVGEYVVRLPQIDSNGNSSGLDATAAQSEIVALNGTSFLMLPRDGNGMGKGTIDPIVFKSVQLVDLASATNILGLKDDEGEQISPGGTLIGEVNAAATAEIINMLEPTDLAKFGLNASTNPSNSNTLNEKMEGMALVSDLSTPQANDFFLFIANDNDFQSSNVKMIDAAGNLVSHGDGRLNKDINLTGITNDAMFYAYRITIDAGDKKFFRFGIK